MKFRKPDPNAPPLTPEQATMIEHLKYGFPLPQMTHGERADLQAMTVFRIKQANIVKEKRRQAAPRVEAAYAEYMRMSERQRTAFGVRSRIARRHGIPPNTLFGIIYGRS